MISCSEHPAAALRAASRSSDGRAARRAAGGAFAGAGERSRLRGEWRAVQCEPAEAAVAGAEEAGLAEAAEAAVAGAEAAGVASRR